MTETPTHTPLPWIANDQHSGANPWRIESDDGVYANDGWIIAECLGPGAEANAAFIIQAVNSHHRLVEAAEAFVAHMRADTFAHGDTPSDLFEQFVAALKEARHG